MMKAIFFLNVIELRQIDSLATLKYGKERTACSSQNNYIITFFPN